MLGALRRIHASTIPQHKRMLTIIPALDFMRSICGSYHSTETAATLRIWPCGYGMAIDLVDNGKTKLVGVVGASGAGIECFAQFGLPNVIRLTGQLDAKTAMRLVCEDPVLEVSIVREAPSVRFSVSIAGNERALYRFNAD